MKNSLSTLVIFILGFTTITFILIYLLDIIPVDKWQSPFYICWGAILYYMFTKED